jgi:hypothetical protein
MNEITVIQREERRILDLKVIKLLIPLMRMIQSL